MYPIETITPLKAELFDHGMVLYNQPHPFKFKPYLYEGFDVTSREKLQEADLRMITIMNPCRKLLL